MQTIILTAISFLFLLPNISALNFNIDSPEKVKVNESFFVIIEAQTSEVYDVKIFVENSDKKIISEIYNGGWKNPRYYLLSVFPQQSKFEIKVLSAGDYPICARLRKPEKTNFDEQCNNITATNTANKDDKNYDIENEENDDEEEIDDEAEDEMDDDKDKDELEDLDIEDGEEITDKNYRNLTVESKIQNEERIMLNSEKFEKAEEKVFITKYQKQKLLILYGFSAFCIIIIILLALKRL